MLASSENCRPLMQPSLETDSQTQGRMDLRYLLNKREMDQVKLLSKEYLRRYGSAVRHDPDAVFYLGDNAANRRTWSCVSNAIPTFRRSGGFFWLPAENRWLVSSEKMSALGFPMRQSTASCMGVRTVPSLDPLRASSMTGNGMHLSNISIILLIGLVCFGQSYDTEDPIDWSAVARCEGKRRRIR